MSLIEFGRIDFMFNNDGVKLFIIPDNSPSLDLSKILKNL